MSYKIKCKNYCIIKIQSYADKYLLDYVHKHNLPLPKQHRDRSQSYYNFQIRLIELITGLTSYDLCNHYFMSTIECGLELVQETSGILYQSGEGWETYMVPIQYSYLINWIKQNTENPIKIVKRTNLGYLGYLRDITWRRKMSEENYKKNPILKNLLTSK